MKDLNGQQIRLRDALAPRNWLHLLGVGFCFLRYGKHCPHIAGIGDRPWDRW